MAANALQSFLNKVASGATPWKNAVRVVSTENITLQGLQTVDTVALAEGDRILVAGQTLAITNGIYIASANKWTRAADMDRDSYAPLGMTVRVMEGDSAGLWVLSAPVSGTIRVGSSELAFAFDGPAASETYDSIVTLDRDAVQTITADAFSKVILALAPTGHVAGVTKVLFLPADTLAAAADLVVPSDLNTADWPTLVVTDDNAIVITALPGGQFMSSLHNLGARDTAAPTISSAIVNVGSNPNALVVTFNTAVKVPNLTGASLSFSVGTARTITAIESVNADATVWTFTLSGNLDGTETCSLVLGATREWQALNGTLIAAGTTSITLTGVWSTADLTGLLLWIDPGQGHATSEGAGVSTVTNQGTLGGTFTQGTGGAQPVYNANGFGTGLPWFTFDGTDDQLTSTLTWGQLTTDRGEWYFFAVVAVDAANSDNASDNNETIMCESAGYWSAMVRSSNGFNGYGFDGATKLAAVSIGSPPTTIKVVEFRSTGGNIYVRVNGGAETSTACGDLSIGADAGTLIIGANRSGTQFLDFKLGEIGFCDGDPGATERNNQASYLVAKYGAT